MLLTFEGIDGSGKSTQAALLLDRLQELGQPVELFREPGGTVVSERVREILLNPGLEIAPFAELLLFSAARAQLVRERIRPAIEQGRIVVCDRFFDSTTAYQGGGRRVADIEWLHGFNQRVTDGLSPDRTYLIDLDPKTALDRTNHRELDRMESAKSGFMARVRETYLSLATAEPERFLVIDGSRAPEAIGAEIQADVRRLLEQRSGTPLHRVGSADTSAQ